MASAADKGEGGNAAREATRTEGTGSETVGDGRACTWGAATTQGTTWPASPIAPVPGQPLLQPHQVGGGGGSQPQWAVCLAGRGAHQGQISREGERDGKGGTLRHGQATMACH